jgi:predicted nucleotidyltransferase component of viral defense system
MILRSEIATCAKAWCVPPDTVDKDYVLGHFLAALYDQYGENIAFKGGTCLRKCYFPDYRFSEDLDFSSLDNNFELDRSILDEICIRLKNEKGILFYPGEIKALESKGVLKGYQVKIKYWGANHSKHDEPPPNIRWSTKIKLEISTEEICLLPLEKRKIFHPYSDKCLGEGLISCYSILEIISEKLRALVQRSYSAPRDIYDIYHLTNDCSLDAWIKIKSVFLEKMNHKDLEYLGPDQLINKDKMNTIIKAWDTSVAHQVNKQAVSKEIQISRVYDLIHVYM